jgi:hypothetical protein
MAMERRLFRRSWSEYEMVKYQLKYEFNSKPLIFFLKINKNSVTLASLDNRNLFSMPTDVQVAEIKRESNSTLKNIEKGP